MRTNFSYFILVLMASLGPACYAQTVSVRVLNARDGRPLKNQPVSVALFYEKGQTTPAKYEPNLNLRTNASGEAGFVLPNPAPDHMSVYVRLTSEYWRCGCRAMADIHDLVQKGVVDLEVFPNDRSAVFGKAVPGQVLILARPFSRWERLLYPFLKG